MNLSTSALGLAFFLYLVQLKTDEKQNWPMQAYGQPVKIALLCGILLLVSMSASAQTMATDTLSERFEKRLLHRVGVDSRAEYIVQTNPFLRGANSRLTPIRFAWDAHLNYSFRFRPESPIDRIYGGAYQGIGVAYYALQNSTELGDPIAIYLLQGGRIARIGSRLTFNYEWNFGLSFGWQPYDPATNQFNQMIGSKVNAYLNADFYLSYLFLRRFELTAGVALTHFSNGNTKFPNAGLNMVGAKIGLTYNFGPSEPLLPRKPFRILRPSFHRHMSYDLTFFGSWRRSGIMVGDKQYAVPNAFPVAGFNAAAMYNFGYKFRAGVSLDGVYDGSANIYLKDQIVPMGGANDLEYDTPSLDRQMALGISARAEFVMPYFTIGMGFGANVLHKGGDLKAFYQMLTLKIAASRRIYLHVGYCLKNFETPNYLMLGVGMRFNDRRQRGL